MESYKERDGSSPSSSEGSFNSSYSSDYSQRPENDRKRARIFKNDAHSRRVDSYREDGLDNNATRNIFAAERSVNEGDQSELNIREPTFMEQSASANLCVAGVQSISEMQLIPHSSTVVGNMFPFMGMQPQPNVPERMDMLGFHEYDGITRQESMPPPAGEVMTFTSCTLYPPSPFIHIPCARPKPIGCNMIIVLNLPEKATKEMVEEIFLTCGSILTVRMNGFMCCHVCFTSEDSVERALHYSGYVMMVEDKEEKVYRTKTIYVECATNSDPRALESFNTHLFSSVIPYSRKELEAIQSKLREETNDEDGGKRDERIFYESLYVLNGWLVKGECVKSNADDFVNAINDVQRLSEKINGRKAKYIDKKNAAERKIEKEGSKHLQQFTVISNFFRAVKQQKVWDQFTKAQRKNIGKFHDEFEQLKNAINKELLNQRVEDDMDISEDEVEEPPEQNSLAKQLEKLEEEHKFLVHQLEVKENDKKNLQHTKSMYESRIKALEAETKQTVVASHNDCNISLNKQVHIISLISTFLSAHHFGASIDYICSYLQQFDPSLRARDIESLMKSYPSVFNEKRTGVGASLETKWTFCDFKPQM